MWNEVVNILMVIKNIRLFHSATTNGAPVVSGTMPGAKPEQSVSQLKSQVILCLKAKIFKPSVSPCPSSSVARVRLLTASFSIVSFLIGFPERKAEREEEREKHPSVGLHLDHWGSHLQPGCVPRLAYGTALHPAEPPGQGSGV